MLQGKHSAILLTFIKLPFVIKIFGLSIFEWPFYTGVTVAVEKCLKNMLNMFLSSFLSFLFLEFFFFKFVDILQVFNAGYLIFKVVFIFSTGFGNFGGTGMNFGGNTSTLGT